MEKQPLFEKYFMPNTSYHAKLIDVEFDFNFQNTWVVDIPFSGKLYIQDRVFDLPQISKKILPLSIGCVVSEAYIPMNPNGVLVGAVGIHIESTGLSRFEKIGSVRVDSGMLQVSNIDVSSIDRSMFKETYSDEYSHVHEIDGKVVVDISAGFGDGEYPVYVAYGSDNTVCAIYVDFLLFDRPDVVEKLISRS